ncbi:MAG: SDR family oxidoreductase [Miltoncostaeaceae bacterium]
MDMGLDGRVALVCGASAGIGRAVAEALAAEGARVAMTSRSAERIEAAAAPLGALPIIHDTADLDAIPDVVARVREHYGAPVEVLVCNTGGPPANPDALGFGRAQWEAAHRALVLAPVEFVAAVVPAMRERGFGRIVNIVSTAAREPIPPLMLSNTERAGALAAFRTISHQVAGDGVTLNSLLTGRIATDRLFSLAGSREEAERRALTEVPAGRLGAPAEMAAAAVFLCSAGAGYITGQAIAVDGGLTRAV